jgi:hypothetical protein
LSDLLALAGTLKALPQEKLATVLAGVAGQGSNLQDLFDLSRVLLTKREVESRIRELSAEDLRSLLTQEISQGLEEAMLSSKDAVFETAVELAKSLSPVVIKPSKNQQAGSPHSAYETLMAVTELLFACERNWLSVIRSGLRAQDAKELSEILKLPTTEIQLRFLLAQRAGLIIALEDRFVATQTGLDWLDKSNSRRWEALAQSVFDLPKMELSDGLLSESIAQQFPLKNQNDIQLLVFGPSLGLLDAGVPTQALKLASAKSLTEAAKHLSEALPAPVSKLIVQADLSITSPGPITPALHKDLDIFAQSEDLGLACRFRLSLMSITHGLETGLSIAQITQTLKDLSERELPQPVNYLLAEAARRFGELTVQESALGTLIACADPILLAQIGNEAGLSALMLRRTSEGKLESRLGVAMIYFNLRQAGYPAVMIDEKNVIVSPRLRIELPLVAIDQSTLDRAARLLSEESKEPAQDDMLRQLQFALKNKLKVTIKLQRPEGHEVEYHIEPLGIAGGRIRGRDLEKEAELTLPLARVSAVWLS